MLRDFMLSRVRPFCRKAADASSAVFETLRTPGHTRFYFTVALAAVVTEVVPVAGPPLCLLTTIALMWNLRDRNPPIRRPPSTGKASHGLDKRDEGLLLLGHDTRGEEAWISKQDVLRHTLVLGTTGAGKSETLIGMATNALAWGSGFIYLDGKGDVSIFARFAELCHKYGRSKDMMVLNFMMSSRGAIPGRFSHRFNPLVSGDAMTLASIILPVSEADPAGAKPDQAVASRFLHGLLEVLCWKRDAGILDLDARTVSAHLDLEKIDGLLAAADGMPEHVASSLRAVMSTWPTHKPRHGFSEQARAFNEHAEKVFGFLFPSLHTMSGLYTTIFAADGTEIDMQDVIRNRRIVVVMLPALEKSSDDLALMARIVVATVKAVLARTLSVAAVGEWTQDEARLDQSAPPFLTILDSVGYALVDGMAQVCAQARALNMGFVFAEDDVPAMKRTNPHEAASLLANTGTKLHMRSCDPDGPLHLAELSEGEANVIVGGKVTHIKTLYRNVSREDRKSCPPLRLNTLLHLGDAR